MLERIKGMLRGSETERRIQEETDFHLEMLARKYEGQGLSHSEAQLAAKKEFGGVTQMQDEFRDQSRLPWLDALLSDMKFAWRSFGKTPAVTALIVVTLALGIGANTAIFSFLNELLLRPLPYPDSDALVFVGRVWRGEPATTAPRDFVLLRDKATSFESIATSFLNRGENVETTGGSLHVRGLTVTEGYFRVLGVQPMLGRTFTKEEDALNGPNAVILSHALWRSTFGGDPNILDKTVKIAGKPHTVAGVMPESFGRNMQAQMWLPLQSTGKGNDTNYSTIARLKPGVSIAHASAEVDALLAQLDKDSPNGRRETKNTAMAISLQKSEAREFRQPVTLLYSGVCVVLFVACLNVANLLLARSAVRAKEIALRAALGAGRLRILRQMLTESLILSLLGGAAGAGLGYLLIVALKRVMPYKAFDNVTLDGTTLLFTLCVSIAAGIVFGLAPAIHSMRVELIDTLKDAGKSASASRPTLRGRQLLVFSQVALCMLLLAGAGLLVRTVVNLRAVEMGFDPRNLLIAPMALNATSLDRDKLTAYYQQGLERVRAIPGVTDAAITTQLPVEGQFNLPVELPDSSEPERVRSMQYRMQTHDAFRALGMRIVRGRDFQPSDQRGTVPVAVVNEAFARTFFRGQDALGKRISMRRMNVPDAFIITGIVNDVREVGLKSAVPPVIYTLVDQAPQRVISGLHRFVPAKWMIRTQPGFGGADVASQIRQAVGSLDPSQPFQQFETMQSIVARTMGMERFLMNLLAGFSLLTLVMVAGGLYGTLSYAVSQRRQEIGIRMAMGARWTNVVAMVATAGLVVVAAGILLGAVSSYWAAKLMSGFLFNVPAIDPLSLATSAAVLLLVALVAAAGPAWNAVRTDPLVALRMD